MIQHVKNKYQNYTVEFAAISYILLLLYLTTKLYLSVVVHMICINIRMYLSPM